MANGLKCGYNANTEKSIVNKGIFVKYQDSFNNTQKRRFSNCVKEIFNTIYLFVFACKLENYFFFPLPLSIRTRLIS